MRGYRQGRTPWMDPSIYPVQENLVHGAEAGSDAPFLVDIAGGLGHDLTEFKNRFPSHPGVSNFPDPEIRLLPTDQICQNIRKSTSKISLPLYQIFKISTQPSNGFRMTSTLNSRSREHEPTLCTLLCMIGPTTSVNLSFHEWFRL